MPKIEKYDSFGRGITYINNKITFIPNTIMGEEINTKIVNAKAKYNEGVVVSILNPSSKRVEPKCPFYGICGGCDLEHMSYTEQSEFKLQKVKKAFEINKLECSSFEFVPSNKDYNYRNKITLKVQNGKFGYYESKTHKIIEIKECYLAKQCINDLLKELQLKDNCNGELIIRCNHNNELLLILNGDINVSINDFSTKVKIVGIVKNGKIDYGDDFLITKINDTYYKYSFDSFFQINDYICAKLFEILKENLIPGNVLDLYCGVGSLSIQEKNENNKVYGIEIVPNAIKNAITNAAINKKEKMYFMLGDVPNIVDKINDAIHNLVVDPPRSGLDKISLKYIIKNKIERIIYISCNPDTLIRDLKQLDDSYNIKLIKVCDMFPNTYHCETICVLERR